MGMGTSFARLFLTALAAAAFACLAGCTGTGEREPESFEVSKVVIPRDKSLPPPAPEPVRKIQKVEPPAEKPVIAERPEEKKPEAEAKALQPVAPAAETKVSPSEDVVKVSMPERKGGSFLTNSSFVTRWNILGPVHVPAEAGIDALHLEYVGDEKSLEGTRNAPEGASWNVKVFKSSEPPGLIDFSPLFPDEKGRCAFYAVSCLECPENLTGLTMHAGSEGLIKVWVNGVLAHAYDKGAREAAFDQDSIGGITLKDGYNRIIVKYVDAVPGGKRRFFLRFSMPDGLPVSTEP